MDEMSNTTQPRLPSLDKGPKAPIEDVVDVTALSVLGPDVFVNTRPPWLPPNARGIFGGTVIAQSLAAAQLTVPDTFLVHSCHSYFLLAGSAEMPIMYYVERVRDGRSFITRTVQARQRGQCLFTTTVSFCREGSGGAKQLRHAVRLPEGVEMPSEEWDDDDGEDDDRGGSPVVLGAEGSHQEELKGEAKKRQSGPYISRNVQVVGIADAGMRPDERRCRRWIRCRGNMSESGGLRGQLNALAYMTDSYLFVTLSRVNGLWSLPFAPEEVGGMSEEKQRQVRAFARTAGLGSRMEDWVGRQRVGMHVSLDHSIYFHEPRRVRADEWMLFEMDSPWSGEGRGLVMQRVFARDGTLLATCIQEGVMRLQQDGTERAAKM